MTQTETAQRAVTLNASNSASNYSDFSASVQGDRELAPGTGCGFLVAAAVDANTGQLLGEREIPANEQGHLEPLCLARELDHEIVWAIEDCRDLSHHLEHALVAAGERVLRVAPKLMGASRRGEREPGKADQIMLRCLKRHLARRYYRLLSDRSRHRIEQQVYPGVP